MWNLLFQSVLNTTYKNISDTLQEHHSVIPAKPAVSAYRFAV